MNEWHFTHISNIDRKIKEGKDKMLQLNIKGEATCLDDKDQVEKRTLTTQLSSLSNIQCSMQQQKRIGVVSKGGKFSIQNPY